jgi:hypothetical protein
VDADDGAIRRYFVSLLNHRNKVFDHDLSRRRVIEIDHALRIAPSVSSWLGRGKSIAIASGIAISSDMVEDQIDSRYHRRYRILGINVEPSRFAPCDRLIETLQDNIVHRSRQARRPILLFQLLGRSRWSVQRTDGKRAANGQRRFILAMILLFDPGTGQPLAIMDGRLITEMRTAAVSAAVTKRLASAESRVLALLGSGVQAKAHLEALSQVRRFAEVRVWSRTPEHARRFAASDSVARRFFAIPSATSVVIWIGLMPHGDPRFATKWIDGCSAANGRE